LTMAAVTASINKSLRRELRLRTVDANARRLSWVRPLLFLTPITRTCTNTPSTVFDSKTLIAKDILGNNAFQNIIGGAVGGIAGATAPVNNALPTKTAGVQLFGAKPTWSAVAEDPAAALGSVWQNAVQDMQNNAMDGQDMQLNEQVAAEEMKKLDEAKGAQNGTAAAEAAKNGTEKAQR
jgi:hypothetical protein